MTEEHPADAPFAARMQNAAFARAYDIWLLVLTERAAEIELARRGLHSHRPRRSRARPKKTARHTVPRTA
ncbi:MAG TPA: hypothetical protein VGR49_04645 [Actinomycetota bacterium]|nr:hypothetical protein [Actinomycetota bacterium]